MAPPRKLQIPSYSLLQKSVLTVFQLKLVEVIEYNVFCFNLLRIIFGRLTVNLWFITQKLVLRIEIPSPQTCKETRKLFLLRIKRSSVVHSVNKMQNFTTLYLTVYIITNGLRRINTFNIIITSLVVTLYTIFITASSLCNSFI